MAIPIPRILGLAAVVALALLMSVPVRADTVTFGDLTDMVIGSHTGSRASIDSAPACGFGTFGIPLQSLANVEGCSATIKRPSATATFNGGMPHLFIVMEGGKISDVLALFTGLDGALHAVFVSDPATMAGEVGLPALTLCSTLGSLCTSSTNERQTISINWSNGKKDTVSFQSDSEGGGVVPEPGSLALLGSGLLAITGFLRKRLA